MSRNRFLLGMILSGAVAGGLAFLKSKKGREFTKGFNVKKDEFISRADEYILKAKVRADELIKEAEANADSILKDANKILKLSREKTSEAYGKVKGNLEEEISRLKIAINASIDAYNRKLKEEEPTEVVIDNIFNESFLHPGTHDRKKSSNRQFHKMKLSMEIDENELE